MGEQRYDSRIGFPYEWGIGQRMIVVAEVVLLFDQVVPYTIIDTVGRVVLVGLHHIISDIEDARTGTYIAVAYRKACKYRGFIIGR